MIFYFNLLLNNHLYFIAKLFLKQLKIKKLIIKRVKTM